MTNTVPVLIEELEGAALRYAAGDALTRPLRRRPKFRLRVNKDDMLRDVINDRTEGPTVQVPASLVGGE